MHVICLPLHEANDKHDGPAGSVYPAKISGFIAWWPGDTKGLDLFTLENYDYGFKCRYNIGDLINSTSGIKFKVIGIKPFKSSDFDKWYWELTLSNPT